MLCILPTGMCYLPVWYGMLVNVLFASCMSVGGCIAVNLCSECVFCEFWQALHIVCHSRVFTFSNKLPCFPLWGQIVPANCLCICLAGYISHP